MKRKITKIGTLLASVALMFGATSWASAQDNKVTITFPANAEFTGFADATIEGADAEKAKIAVTSVTAPTSSDAKVLKKSGNAGQLEQNYDQYAALGSSLDYVGIQPAWKGSGDQSSFTFTVEAANGYAFVPDEVYFDEVRNGR